MSVPNIVTCLLPWGRTGASPSRLALFARPAPPACGLDRLPPARQGLAKRVSHISSRVDPEALPLAGNVLYEFLLEGINRRVQAFPRRMSMTRVASAPDGPDAAQLH
jgi:hypothetical protein